MNTINLTDGEMQLAKALIAEARFTLSCMTLTESYFDFNNWDDEAALARVEGPRLDALAGLINKFNV